jgi:hypothetical protein
LFIKLKAIANLNNNTAVVESYSKGEDNISNKDNYMSTMTQTEDLPITEVVHSKGLHPTTEPLLVDSVTVVPSSEVDAIKESTITPPSSKTDPITTDIPITPTVPEEVTSIITNTSTAPISDIDTGYKTNTNCNCLLFLQGRKVGANIKIHKIFLTNFP